MFSIKFFLLLDGCNYTQLLLYQFIYSLVYSKICQNTHTQVIKIIEPQFFCSSFDSFIHHNCHLNPTNHISISRVESVDGARE